MQMGLQNIHRDIDISDEETLAAANSNLEAEKCR